MEKGDDVKGDFTIELPKKRGSEDKFTIHLNEIDEQTFMFASKLGNEGKITDLVRLVLRSCYAGGDPIEEVLKNWYSVHAAMAPITELIETDEVELKKN